MTKLADAQHSRKLIWRRLEANWAALTYEIEGQRDRAASVGYQDQIWKTASREPSYLEVLREDSCTASGIPLSCAQGRIAVKP